MDPTDSIRIVFASDTSGHTAGYHVVARALRDAGCEVVITGRQLPRETARVAIEEGADVIAVRIMDRDPVEYLDGLYAVLREHGVEDTPVVVGGIVGKADAERLRAMGVAGIYPPGSKLSAIVEGVRKAVAERRGA